MVRTVIGIDAMGINAHNIPPQTPYVFGYVTGSGDVPWNKQEWTYFPHSQLIRYDQSPDGAAFATGHADVYDVEALAGKADHVPNLVRERIKNGLQWSTIYGSDGAIQLVVRALESVGSHGWYFGHVDVGLANWNLSEAEAASLIGQGVHGLTCRYVQWASPSSNPETPVPGSSLTLAVANVDLNVVDGRWVPGEAMAHPKTSYVCIRLPDGASARMESGQTLP